MCRIYLHGVSSLPKSMTWFSLYVGHLHTLVVTAILMVVARGIGSRFEGLFPVKLSLVDRAVWSIATGLIVGGTLLFLIGQVAWKPMTVWPLIGVAGVMGGSIFWRERSEWSALRQDMIISPGCWLALGCMGLFTLSGMSAIGGDIGHDGISYHLLGPLKWWQNGIVEILPEHSHTAFPAIIEMWFAAAQALGRIEAAGVLGVVFLALLLILIGRFARELGATRNSAGWLMGIAATMPVIVSTTDDYFVDVPFAVFSLLALRAAVTKPSLKTAVITAIFVGGCIGTKYTGVLVASITGLIILWSYLSARISWRRLLAHAGTFLLVALAIGLPCYLRNIAVLGTPIIPPPPFLSELWPAVGWPTEITAAFHRRIQLEVGAGFGGGFLNLILLPWHFTFYPDVFRGGHGTWTILAMAPLGLWMIRKNRLAIRYLVWAGLLTLLWFQTQQNARFLTHVIALLTAISAVSLPVMLTRAGRPVAWLTQIIILATIIFGLVGFVVFRTDRILATLTPKGTIAWHQAEVPYHQSIDWLNQHDEVGKVLLLSKWVPGVYLDKPYVKTAGHYGNRPFPDIDSPVEALRQLHRWQATHVLDVVQDGWLIPTEDDRFTLIFDGGDARIYSIIQ